MKYLLVLVLVFVLPLPCLAIEYSGNCSIVFHGSSTLHDFQGNGSCQPFTVKENAGTMIPPELKVVVAEMETGNAKRDKKMREMFAEEQFPLITGTSSPISLDDLRRRLELGKDSAGDVTINLKIRDITRPVKTTVHNIVITDSTIKADMDFPLFLADYQLKPPSVLGLIRVGDRIDVTVSFVLESRQ